MIIGMDANGGILHSPVSNGQTFKDLILVILNASSAIP
jgi:hypothetical protein